VAGSRLYRRSCGCLGCGPVAQVPIIAPTPWRIKLGSTNRSPAPIRARRLDGSRATRPPCRRSLTATRVRPSVSDLAAPHHTCGWPATAQPVPGIGHDARGTPPATLSWSADTRPSPAPHAGDPAAAHPKDKRFPLTAANRPLAGRTETAARHVRLGSWAAGRSDWCTITRGEQVRLSCAAAADRHDRRTRPARGANVCGGGGVAEHIVRLLPTRRGFGGGAGPLGRPADPSSRTRPPTGCRVLAAVAGSGPIWSVGPLRRAVQQWFGTARHGQPRTGAAAGAHHDLLDPPASRSSFTGLFTARQARTGRTDGNLYGAVRGLRPYPLPWACGRSRCGPSVRVLEIAGAADWTGLVGRYPAGQPGPVYPDWPAVAADQMRST